MAFTNSARCRYVRRFLPLIWLYGICAVAANSAITGKHAGGALLVALALLPVLPIAFMIIAIGNYLAEERDEYLRMQLVLAMLVGTGLLLVAATGWGFLENKGLLGTPPSSLAFPLWLCGVGVAQFVFTLRDRFSRRIEIE